MNNFITTTLISLLLLTSFNANAEKIDRTINVEPRGRIDIEIMDGKVAIEGWDRPEVRIVGNIPINAHNFSFEARGSDAKIEHTGEHGFWGNTSNSGQRARAVETDRPDSTPQASA